MDAADTADNVQETAKASGNAATDARNASANQLVRRPGYHPERRQLAVARIRSRQPRHPRRIPPRHLLAFEQQEGKTSTSNPHLRTGRKARNGCRVQVK